MNYLIVDNNSVFVAKTDIAVLKAKIQHIELQKPMLSTWCINNQVTEVAYCQQIVTLLQEDFASGFSKIEMYKQRLCTELQNGFGSNSYAVWVASDILIQLRVSLNNAIAFDRLLHCNVLMSHLRDELISRACKYAKNPTIELMGNVLSLAFKLKDVGDIGKMFWYYNRIVNLLGENPQYENERNLLTWAKGQRAHAFFAFIPTLVGGAENIAHIIDEATAQRDLEQYGQQSLCLRN